MFGDLCVCPSIFRHYPALKAIVREDLCEYEAWNGAMILSAGEEFRPRTTCHKIPEQELYNEPWGAGIDEATMNKSSRSTTPSQDGGPQPRWRAPARMEAKNTGAGFAVSAKV